MAAIIALPRDVILELAKFLDVKDCLALLQTCNTLYDIAKDREFWVYYIKRLCAQYNPVLPRTFAAMSFKGLRRMASTPYRLENALAEGKLDRATPLSWKMNTNVELCGAKLVPGGHWLVTLGEEWMHHRVVCRPVIRIWRVRFDNTAQPLACACIFPMSGDWVPVEVEVARGDGPHDIIIIFNAIDRKNPLDGSNLKLYKVDLSAERLEPVLIAETNASRMAKSARLQHDYIFANVGFEVDDYCRWLIWNWRTGEKQELSGPGNEDIFWFLASCETRAIVFNRDDLAIELHPRDTRQQVEKVSAPPLGGSSSTGTSDREEEQSPPWTVGFYDVSGKQYQVAVAHYQRETICAIIEDYGRGRVTVRRYPRELRPTKWHLIWAIGATVSGHIIAMSVSGLVYVCWMDEINESINNGVSSMFYPLGFTDNQQPAGNRRYPFLCPFAGVIGNVTSTGTFYLWRVT